MNRFKYPRAKIKQAIKFIKSKKGAAPVFLTKFPGQFAVRQGKLYAGKRQVIAQEDRDEYLREVVYGKSAEYPFGRDSLFAILKHEVLNVSKRNIEAFLNAQKPIVHRRARPKKEKREHLRSIRKPGILSVDLVHIRAKDFEALFPGKGYDYMGPPGEKGYQQDRYFLNAVDLLTGFLLTRVLQGKTPARVVPKLKQIIDEFKTVSGHAVRQMEFDYGGEFLKEVLTLLKKEKITRIQRRTNATVEQKNAHMQRVFYNLAQQRRGGFMTTVKQAVTITNRTLNRRTGLSAVDAMAKIVAGEKVAKRLPQAHATERKKAFPVGTKVRALKKKRSKGDSLGYKAYKADHYGQVLPITKVRFIGVYPKYKVGKRWMMADEVIKARPGDRKSHNKIIKRPVVMPEAKPQRRGTRRSARIAAQKKKPKPKKRDWYEIGDEVQALVEDEWHDAEIEGFSKKDSPFDYDIFYHSEGKRWGSEVKAEWVRPRP